MTNKQFNEIMNSINLINSRVDTLALEIENLKGNTVSKAKKSTPKKTASSKVDDLAKFQPKADADGNYNYKSWKTCRAKYVAAKTGKKDEWIDYAEFCKIAAPFDKKYPYVKKADR